MRYAVTQQSLNVEEVTNILFSSIRGFLRRYLGWKIQPGILTVVVGGVLAKRIQPGIPMDPSCGDLVVWEERKEFA